MKPIITSYEWPAMFPPYWLAHFEGEEESGKRGQGDTPEAAIDDLLALHGDDNSNTVRVLR